MATIREEGSERMVVVGGEEREGTDGE